LKWYESPAPDKSNLFVDFPLSASAETVAAALRELLSITKGPMVSALQQLPAAKAAAV
jgi:hypothetical protein